MTTIAVKAWPAFMSDDRRACRGTDPDIFFPPPGNSHAMIGAAKVICRRCPFRRECRAYADENGLVGIWGGTPEYERRHAVRREPTYDEIAAVKREEDR